jgi:hypothetical protein
MHAISSIVTNFSYKEVMYIPNKVKNLLNENGQNIETDENELPDDYKEFQEKIEINNQNIYRNNVN